MNYKTIDLVLKTISIVKLVERYTSIKPVEEESCCAKRCDMFLGRMQGTCPICRHKWPFYVHEKRGIWWCGEGNHAGNSIDFIMKMYGLGLPDAVMKLIEMFPKKFPKAIREIRKNSETSREDKKL